ncbi:histidine phosphatase family protein, partial [Crocosphaera sp. Alani8]|uniref:histidine phosphatase family protein n=1 Tax=Crocosphaera sp. Alani8 TaxID=3038952 RepID=UPI00313CF2A4
VGDADLLVSPELAAALQNTDLTGADVGDARVDGFVSLVDDTLPVVSFNLRTEGGEGSKGGEGSEGGEGGEGANGWSPGDSADFVTPPPTYEGELTSGEQANQAFVDLLEGQALLDDLQEGGYVIYIRHAQTERDFADQADPSLDIEDFSTQRVVSEFGVQQSLAIGEGFELSHIPYDTVITSQYGRAIETAAIAFGQYHKDPALNFLPFEDYTPEQIQEMRDNVTPLLTDVPNAGTNTVIVGHDDIFEA